MKKGLLCILLMLSFLLCGCMTNVNYQTKYITNCATTELRKAPSNASTVRAELTYGEAVSYEKDEKNGYSKVAYNGLTGYVLSSMLSSEKPTEKSETSVTVQQATPQPAPKTTTVPQPNNDYGYLISTESSSQIENYITNHIRPAYNSINSYIDSCSKTYTSEGTEWYNAGLVKKEITQGTYGFNMTRQYYYNTYSGQVMFAFFFRGDTEYRFYFSNDKLIRYIDAGNNIINNPTDSSILAMADRVINEAY